MNLSKSNQKILLFLAVSALAGTFVLVIRSSRNDSIAVVKLPALEQQGHPDKIRTEIIDINSATKEQLMQVQGIGPVMSEWIIDYRNKVKTINNMEELKNIKGIGSKKLKMLKKHFICNSK